MLMCNSGPVAVRAALSSERNMEKLFFCCIYAPCVDENQIYRPDPHPLHKATKTREAPLRREGADVEKGARAVRYRAFSRLR